MSQRAKQIGVACGQTDRTLLQGCESISHRAAGCLRELVLKGRAWLPMATNNGEVGSFKASRQPRARLPEGVAPPIRSAAAFRDLEEGGC